MEVRFLSVQVDLAGGDGIGGEDGARHLRAAGADQACQTDDLAGVDLEADIVHLGGVEVLDVEHDLLLRRVAAQGGVSIADVAADHLGDELLLGGLGRLHGGDMLAVLQDDDLVRDAEDLVHTVGNVDDGHSLGLLLLDALEHELDLLLGEGRGGLVVSDDVAVAAVSLHDLDHLLVGDGEAADDLSGVDVQTEEVDERFRVIIELFPVHQRAFALHGKRAGIDVFHYRHAGHELALLVNDADARGMRVVR